MYTTILYFFWDGFSGDSAVAPDPPSILATFSINRSVTGSFEV